MRNLQVYGTIFSAQSGASTLTGAAIQAPGGTKELSIEITTTGTLTGTFTLQVSHDGGATFADYAGASASFTNPAGGAVATYQANFENVPGSHWRLKYTATSGSGNITAKFSQNDIL